MIHSYALTCFQLNDGLPKTSNPAGSWLAICSNTRPSGPRYAAIFVVVNVHAVNVMLSQDSVCQLYNCAWIRSLLELVTGGRFVLPTAFGSVSVRLAMLCCLAMGNVNSKVTLPVDNV